jgi:hypothetical protein
MPKGEIVGKCLTGSVCLSLMASTTDDGIGHVGKDRHFADWRVKGTMFDWRVKGTGFPNLSKSRYAKSRLNLSRQIKV